VAVIQHEKQKNTSDMKPDWFGTFNHASYRMLKGLHHKVEASFGATTSLQQL